MFFKNVKILIFNKVFMFEYSTAKLNYTAIGVKTTEIIEANP